MSADSDIAVIGRAMDSIHFRMWVANSVHAVSGIWPFEWRGSQRKRPLTFSESRESACQVAFVDFSDASKQANKRARRLAGAHVGQSLRNPRLQ